jgi:hypothetical protein
MEPSIVASIAVQIPVVVVFAYVVLQLVRRFLDALSESRAEYLASLDKHAEAQKTIASELAALRLKVMEHESSSPRHTGRLRREKA